MLFYKRFLGHSSERCTGISELSSTDLADKGKSLPPHPLGTVAEPDGELVDEVQAQIVSATCIQLLEDLYNLRTQEGETHLKVEFKTAVNLQKN